MPQTASGHNHTLMKRAFVIISITFCTAIQLFSQSAISGFIRNGEGSGVDMASVIVSPPDSPKTILGATITDESGQFRLSVDSPCDSIIINVSGMDIESTSLKVPNLNGTYDIVVAHRTIELKDIVVKARKIYSREDTVNYNVASFLSPTDQSVADVLRRMPGITVSQTGQISYQGKPIKKFYIEGLDLMKGHYGIATNNIDPNNIATVQVLENHQDIKALKGLRSEEQASINLRLKEGVRGVFNLIATLGGGYSDKTLWNNQAIATYFRRNSQLLATYKGNNTGEDLSQELYSFDNDWSRTSNISSVAMPSAPGIDKRFYYFNRSHSTTFNNVYRVGASGEIGINAAYLHDRDTGQSRSTTTNFLPDGAQNILDESMEGIASTQKAYGDLTYMNNGDANYLKEQIKFDWSTSDTRSAIAAAGDKVNQSGKTAVYRLLNKFHATHRNSADRGFEITSLINMEKRPHSLSVAPNLFPDIIAASSLSQTVDCRNISAENNARLLTAFRLRNFSLHPSAIANYHHNSLESRLETMRNDISLDYLDVGIGAEIVFSARKIHAELYIPLKYRHFNLKNNIEGTVTTKSRFRPEPDFSMTYKINTCHNLLLRASMSYALPSVETLYSGYILTSYRQLSVYDVPGLYEGLDRHCSLGYTFRNILSMSFAGAEISWSSRSPEVLYGSYFDGIVQRTISRRTSESGHMVRANLNASQGFDRSGLKIGAAFTYSYYDNPLLVQNELIRYNGNSLTVTADISLRPFRWLGLSYQGIASQSATRQKGSDRFPWLRTITNKAAIDFTVPGGVTLTTSLYHYYNNFNDGNPSFLMVGAGGKYDIGRFSLMLTCDNLLNHKTYSYSTLSALTESKAAYTIRPRSILLKIRFRII